MTIGNLDAVSISTGDAVAKDSGVKAVMRCKIVRIWIIFTIPYLNAVISDSCYDIVKNICVVAVFNLNAVVETMNVIIGNDSMEAVINANTCAKASVSMEDVVENTDSVAVVIQYTVSDVADYVSGD